MKNILVLVVCNLICYTQAKGLLLPEQGSIDFPQGGSIHDQTNLSKQCRNILVIQDSFKSLQDFVKTSHESFKSSQDTVKSLTDKNKELSKQLLVKAIENEQAIKDREVCGANLENKINSLTTHRETITRDLKHIADLLTPTCRRDPECKVHESKQSDDLLRFIQTSVVIQITDVTFLRDKITTLELVSNKSEIEKIASLDLTNKIKTEKETLQSELTLKLETLQKNLMTCEIYSLNTSLVTETFKNETENVKMELEQERTAKTEAFLAQITAERSAQDAQVKLFNLTTKNENLKTSCQAAYLNISGQIDYVYKNLSAQILQIKASSPETSRQHQEPDSTIQSSRDITTTSNAMVTDPEETVTTESWNHDVSTTEVADFMCSPIISDHVGYNDPTLVEAAKMGDFELLKTMLENGSLVDSIGEEEYTALHWATENNNLEMISYLVEHCANLSVTNNEGNTALHFAAMYNKLDIVSYLVEHGANVSTTNNDNKTALHYAAWFNTVDIVSYLVKHGANVSVTNNKGWTALHFAAYHHTLDIVIYLVEHGANVSTTDIFGNSALHEAARYNKLDIVTFIVEQGANVSTTNNFGNTALHEAAEYNTLDIITYLIEQGANVSTTNNFGFTPLEVARMRNNSDVISYLETKS